MQEKNENITKIIEKLSQYIEYKQINFSQIALKIGLSNSYFSKMLKNNGSLGEDIIRKILLFYDDINPSWLIINEGPMLKSNFKNDKLINEQCQNCHEKERVIKTQEKLIASLEDNIAYIREKLGDCAGGKQQKKVV